MLRLLVKVVLDIAQNVIEPLTPHFHVLDLPLAELPVLLLELLQFLHELQALEASELAAEVGIFLVLLDSFDDFLGFLHLVLVILKKLLVGLVVLGLVLHSDDIGSKFRPKLELLPRRTVAPPLKRALLFGACLENACSRRSIQDFCAVDLANAALDKFQGLLFVNLLNGTAKVHLL